jgi:hypothetical protein
MPKLCPVRAEVADAPQRNRLRISQGRQIPPIAGSSFRYERRPRANLECATASPWQRRRWGIIGFRSIRVIDSTA